jgi:hypothetical protein
MSRFTLRFIPLLALLFALSAVARADSFQITFTGIGSGTGQFTTDGVCTMCSPGAGPANLACRSRARYWAERFRYHR